MVNIHLVKNPPTFSDALNYFKSHLQLDYTWVEHHDDNNISVKNGEFAILINAHPEHLNAVRDIHKFRENVNNTAIPILFLSEDLSPDMELMFQDFEFIWRTPLPFHSGEFFSQLEKLTEFCKRERGLLISRTKIQRCLAAQDFRSAYDLLKDLAGKYDNKFKIHILSGQAAVGLNQLDEALEEAKNALNLNKDSFEANSLAARIHRLRGEDEQANEIISSMTKVTEIYLRNLIHWGDVYTERGEASNATSAYERALAQDPENIKAKEGLLASNLLEGKVTMVQDSLNQTGAALELARICNLKGISMAQSGKFKVAESLYNNAIRFLPKSEKCAHKLWLNLGLCMKKKGDLKAALHYFHKCQEAAPPGYDRVQAQITHTQAKLEEERKKNEQEAGGKSASGTVINYKKDL